MLANFAWLYSHVRHIVDHSDSESTFMCMYRTLFLYCWPRACQETLLYCVYNSCSSAFAVWKRACASQNWENCTLADTYLFYVRIFLLWYVGSKNSIIRKSQECWSFILVFYCKALKNILYVCRWSAWIYRTGYPIIWTNLFNLLPFLGDLFVFVNVFL